MELEIHEFQLQVSFKVLNKIILNQMFNWLYCIVCNWFGSAFDFEEITGTSTQSLNNTLKACIYIYSKLYVLRLELRPASII